MKSSLSGLIAGIAFGKFSKLLPVKKIKETNTVIAFWHPKPLYEEHILIVPKKSIRSLVELNDKDLMYINDVYRVAVELINELNLKNNYSVITNGGSRQNIKQLHFHLISGDKK